MYNYLSIYIVLLLIIFIHNLYYFYIDTNLGQHILKNPLIVKTIIEKVYSSNGIQDGKLEKQYMQPF